ncbi:MAG TPA: histidine kinase [Verrucomicrobiae bacterium]|nr:histidine kinase [Verrucomicrobiae bacterium]
MAKYDKAVALAGELNVGEEDILHILPKIRMASQAMMNGEFSKADTILGEALEDLALINSQRPEHLQRTFRLEWLEIYREIIQKYAILALLAFLLIRVPYFRRMLHADRISVMGKVYLAMMTVITALFFSFFDVSRYGESAWAFFDIQVVLLAIGGLLGGLWPGVLSGFLVGAFRWVLNPELHVYFWIALAAGTLGGLGARSIRSFRNTAKAGLLTGAAAGTLHGALVYIPLARELSWTYALMSILFLALMEGGAVFVFLAVVSGILREDHRREMETELLQTKLLFLQAQISPHFLFNALNTISAICHRENAHEARKLVLNLADFFRRAIKRVDDKITLREELGYIDSYLELEKARFQERLRVEKVIEIPEALWNAKIPFLVLQPLVENAIKHGISKKEEGGRLTIRISESGKCLEVEVKDDGAGADADTMEKILSREYASGEFGIGLQNINQRLVRLYGKAHRLKFSGKAGQGLSVTVRLPVSQGEK